MIIGGDLTGGVDVFVTVVNVGSLRVGVAARGAGLVAVKDGLLVGVKDLAVDRGVGVEDLAGSAGLLEPMVGREVGVEDLAGLDVAVEAGLDVAVEAGLDDEAEVGLDVMLEVVLVSEFDMVLDADLPVGVAGLEPGPPEDTGREPGPPDEDGLRSPPLEVLNPGDDTCCLGIVLFLPVASGWVFDSYTRSIK